MNHPKQALQSATLSRDDKPYPLSPTAFPGSLGPSFRPEKLLGELDSSYEPMFPDARLEQFKKGTSIGRQSQADTSSTQKSSLDSREQTSSQEAHPSMSMDEPRSAKEEIYPSRYQEFTRSRPHTREFNDRQREFSIDQRGQSKERIVEERSVRRARTPERREFGFSNGEGRSSDPLRIDDRWDEVSEASFGQEGYRGPRRPNPEGRPNPKGRHNPEGIYNPEGRHSLEERHNHEGRRNPEGRHNQEGRHNHSEGRMQNRISESKSWLSDEFIRENHDRQEGPRTPRSSRHDCVERQPLHYCQEDDLGPTPQARYYGNEGRRAIDRPYEADINPGSHRNDFRVTHDDFNDRSGYLATPRSPRLPTASPRKRSDFLEKYDNDRARTFGKFWDEKNIDPVPVCSPIYARDERPSVGRGRSPDHIPIADYRERDLRPKSPDDRYGRGSTRLPPRGRSKSRDKNLRGTSPMESSYGRARARESQFSEEYFRERSRETGDFIVESDRNSVGSSLSDFEPMPRREWRNKHDDDYSTDASPLQPQHRVYHRDETSFSEESESNYNSGRDLCGDKRSTSIAGSRRERSRSAVCKTVTPTHFVIEVQEKSKPEDREVTFSPSTEIPVPAPISSGFHHDVKESCQLTEDRTYSKRLADAALMKEQSEARHQILREVRQAMEMRDISTEADDRSFWEKQIATLNNSLKRLCSQHDSTPPGRSTAFVDTSLGSFTTRGSEDFTWNNPAPVQSNFTTVKVQAPENLPAGHFFTVRLSGRVLRATVPKGGVRRGDIFSIRIPLDPVEPVTSLEMPSPASVKVRAPASLPEGYRFTAKMGDRTIVATVPSGGVQKGQIFSVPVFQDHQLSI